MTHHYTYNDIYMFDVCSFQAIGFCVIVLTLNGGEASTSHDASKSTSAAGAGAMIRLQLGEVSLSQIGKLDT